MKQISLAKIIVALLICNAYVFTCGVAGVIDEVNLQETTSEAEQSESVEDELHGQGTVDFIVPEETEPSGQTLIEQLTFIQPPLSDRPVQSVFEPSDNTVVPEEQETAQAETEEVEEVLVVTDEAEEAFDNAQESHEIVPVETTAATTTSVTTTAATTTAVTTTAATTTATTTTTTATTTTATTTATTTDDFGGGIRVDDEPEETEETVEQPIEIPIDSDAAGEILYVNNGGVTVSGTALDIISRITQTEIGYTFAPEAIKAQAVASYTYVKFCNKYGSYPSVILSDTVNDSVRTLVASVIGKAVYYNGSLIQAVYSASSAGYTASSENVWGNRYEYLSSVYCELDKDYDPNYGRTASFSSDDIRQRVLDKTGIELNGEPETWFSIESRIDGNYVGKLSIGGCDNYVDSDGDTINITGRVFRERIMSFDVRSSAFDIDYDADSDTFIITTYGYGHGVGMSQNGANNLATYWGWDYKQILEFYYSGAEVY